MGLIRKTLSVGTVGVVKGSSKKQRTAKATLQEMRKQTAELQRQNAILDGSAEAAAKAKAKRDANVRIAKAQKKALKSPTPENLKRLSDAYALAGYPLAVGRTGLEGLQTPRKMREQTAVSDGSVPQDAQRKALDALRKEQWRAGADPTPRNVSTLRAAEERVRGLGLEVTDLRRV